MNRFTYPLAKVQQAIKFLKTKRGPEPSFLKKFPGQYTVDRGKLIAGDLQVIPTEHRDHFLRNIVYGKKSEYPFGRDSLFSILKNEVMNVSKRDIEKFLNEQGPLIHRRSRPKKETRVVIRTPRKVGVLSVDLAHITHADVIKILGNGAYEYMGEGTKDRYFLNAVDRLTAYLLSTIITRKKAWMVAPALSKLIDEFEKLTGQKVTKVEVDAGGEFKGQTKEMLHNRGIRVQVMRNNALVEGVNAKMQRIFWNLVEQRRGGFLATGKQATKISNRTINRRTGLTPDEAIKKIKAKEVVSHKRPKAGPTERKKALPIGTKVRYLKKDFARAKGDTLGYKAYRGEHYGAVVKILNVRYYGVHPKYQVLKAIMTNPPQYEKHASTGRFKLRKGKKIHKAKRPAYWVWGDELIKSRPEDTKSHNLYIRRNVQLPKNDYVERRPRFEAHQLPRPKNAKPLRRFKRGQWVLYNRNNKKVVGKIKGLKRDSVNLELKSGRIEDAPKDKLDALPPYKTGDKILVREDDKWCRGEILDEDEEGFDVRGRQDNKPWHKVVPYFDQQFMQMP